MVIYRNWGLMAVVVLLFPVLSLAFLMDYKMGIAFLAGGISLGIGGLLCLICGLMWNRPSTQHSLYFIPLEYWGLLYILFACSMFYRGLLLIAGKGI